MIAMLVSLEIGEVSLDTEDNVLLAPGVEDTSGYFCLPWGMRVRCFILQYC